MDPFRPARAAPAIAALAFALGAAAAAPVANGQTASGQEASGARAIAPDFSAVARDRLPAVVNVSTTQRAAAGPDVPGLPPGTPFRDFFGAPDGQVPPGAMTALGSGFVVDPDGYVVTNNHVVQDADEIRVVLHDDRELPADLVGTDPATDLALLKVETDEDLPALSWGDSDASEVGDWVVAIGNPFGLGGTVTAGIISAKTRDIHAGPYDAFIQTDAAVNQGNSGGPLLNLDGQVIGVNTAIFSPSGGSVGIGFAIPSALARAVVADLRDDGAVERGWLGVSIQPVTDEIAEALGLDQAEGALVSSVVDGSPAAEAGIETGDVIVGLGGTAIEDGRALARAVADLPEDEVVSLALLRDGERTELPVTIGRLPAADDRVAGIDPGEGDVAEDVVETLGMHVATLTPELRARFDIADDVRGLVVTEVEPGGVAAREGLLPGDVIAEAGRRQILEPQALQDAIRAAGQDGRNAILLLRRRDRETAFLALPIEPQTGDRG